MVLSVLITPLCSFGKDTQTRRPFPPDLHRLLLVVQYYYRVKGSTAGIVNLQAQMALQVLSGLIPHRKKKLPPYNNANWKVDESLSVTRRTGRITKPLDPPSVRQWLLHKSKLCHFCLNADTLTRGSSDYFDVRAPAVCPGHSNVVQRRPVIATGTYTRQHTHWYTPTQPTEIPLSSLLSTVSVQ